MINSATIAPPELDELCVNTLRFLAVDAVQKAKSGHPGLPLGSAAMAYELWDRFLKFNPCDPIWPDRDRFVLSAGHGCALRYALLHMTGFALPLEELERFRQWGSDTPGHPEYGKTEGVEATTGPLGQGLANAVGMAIAEVALAARFNRPGHTIVDHYTYVLASDGDLEEGISSEAGSEAGHLRLGKLIVLYADNHITIEGSTRLAFTEDRMARFAAFGWHVQRIEDSNDAVARALEAAREEKGRHSLIQIRTHIGFGSPHKQDTAAAHGEPLKAASAKTFRRLSALDGPRQLSAIPAFAPFLHRLAARVKTAGKEFVGDQRERYLVEEQGEESPYERLLDDAMAGDGALFTREVAVEAAWAVVEPVLETHHPTRPYKHGSWGPKEADVLIAADGCWHNSKPTEVS